jgi:iron complex transport system substrate-binding protein
LKIVSLVPSITKELITLNISDNIVGATSYCEITKTNKKLIVGNAIDVNIEKILLLKPDIVFASTLNKQNDIETLKNNNIEVYTLKKMHSFNEICQHFTEIAKIVDKQTLAESIIKKANLKIDSLKNSIKIKDSLSVFFQIGNKPIFSVIPNTFMNDYIIFAGCKNIMYDLKRGTVTKESVVTRNPDVILITSMQNSDTDNIWKNYTKLNAVKNNKIFILDATTSSLPTVLSFTQTFEDIVNLIYN